MASAILGFIAIRVGVRGTSDMATRDTPAVSDAGTEADAQPKAIRDVFGSDREEGKFHLVHLVYIWRVPRPLVWLDIPCRPLTFGRLFQTSVVVVAWVLPSRLFPLRRRSGVSKVLYAPSFTVLTIPWPSAPPIPMLFVRLLLACVGYSQL